jgi:hypothetical protein
MISIIFFFRLGFPFGVVPVQANEGVEELTWIPVFI